MDSIGGCLYCLYLCKKYRNMKNVLGLNDNYACIYSYLDKKYNKDRSKVSFYYGYEATDGEDEGAEWCFVASQNGKELKKYTTSQLKEHCGDDISTMEGFLIQGMYMFFNGI